MKKLVMTGISRKGEKDMKFSTKILSERDMQLNHPDLLYQLRRAGLDHAMGTGLKFKIRQL